jgi:hypothetical protein
MKSVTLLGDPCPLPDANSEKRRRLSEKQKLLVHAPMTDLGGVVYDKDAVWVNVPGSFSRDNVDRQSFLGFQNGFLTVIQFLKGKASGWSWRCKI